MAQGVSIALRASPEDEGIRLDSFLARHPEVGSRTRANKLIEEGAVAVNGRRRPKSYRMQAGDAVEGRVPREAPPKLLAEDILLPVVFEDEYLLVVDKPAGMVTHPSKGHSTGTLVHALLARGLEGGEPFRPGVVHRLDRDTSGLLIAAKSEKAHRLLSELIRRRELTRVYLVLVHGNLAAEEGSIEAPIGRDPVRRKTMTVGGAAARPAVTHFWVRERLGDFTLLEAQLETGRTHQIRVHFLAIGHPVAGDPVYARRDTLALGRQFLHSHRMEFVHPFTGKTVRAVSPLPCDLEEILTGLRSS
jgi:23S rRNA pseudouridine1911/1915/1917 synthase